MGKIKGIGGHPFPVIPARPGVFDIDAVKETIDFSRQLRKPYAVVINAAPPRHFIQQRSQAFGSLSRCGRRARACVAAWRKPVGNSIALRPVCASATL